MTLIAKQSASGGIEENIDELTTLVGRAKLWAVNHGEQFAANALASAVILLAGIWAVRLLRALVRRVLAARGMDPTLTGYVCTLIHALGLIMVVIAALAKLGVPTAQFAAMIAAAGLAVGLALQGNLSNFASGFLLIFFRPIKAGDYVNAGNAEGTVEDIGVFTTTLRTRDNKKAIVPNSAITGGVIVNFNAYPTRMIAISVSVTPGNDLDHVLATLLSAAANTALVLKEPTPVAVIRELAEGKVVTELRAWCKTEDFGNAVAGLNASVKTAIDQSSATLYHPPVVGRAAGQ